MGIRIASPAFSHNSAVPKKYAYRGEGENLSPPLEFSALPEGTAELALVCDDPDAPTPEPWVHWVVYKIPPTRTKLSQGAGGGILQGKNSWNEIGWGGPMPPRGHGVHHYHFKVYALKRAVDLEPGLTKNALLTAIKPHVIDHGELVGTYERR